MNYQIFENAFWWQSEKDQAHEGIHEFINVLRDEQDGFYSNTGVNLGLYNGRPNRDREGSMGYYSSANQPRLTFNIIHSICQAATAKIAKHKPAVRFLTEGGNFSSKRKSKLLTKLIQGQFYGMDIYPLAQKVFLDACISGTGVIKIFSEFGKIKTERVPIGELTLDPLEVEYGTMPRQLFQTKKVSRHVLAAMYPEKQQEIMEADSGESSNDGYDRSKRDSDMILCHEAWHLPSGPDSSDGRHVICIETATLLDKEWTQANFPFVFIRWTENPVSFWGNGLAKEVKGIQIEINKLLARIQEQMHLATPKVFIEDTAKIVQAHLNNRVWGAIKYRGTPPTFFVPRAVSGEMFSHLDRLVDRAYEMSGISQLAAQSKKPVGLESGRALREFSDIESERFMVVGQAYEKLFIDISKQIVNLASKIHTEEKPFTTMSIGKDSMEKISWSDIDLEEEQYTMKVMPVGSLPQTPAAKLSSVAEMHMNGFFTTEEAHQLLDFPDLEYANKLKTASIEIIDRHIEEIVENNNFLAPEPYMSLEFGILRVQQAYNLGMIEDVPEERLELLRRWISQAEALIMQAAEIKPPPPMPAGPMGPMAPPPGAMPPMAPPAPQMGPPQALPPMAPPPGAPGPGLPF
tara:strand:- start:10571 stop:12466 length:1896 start_codon:yes stop_codon:yes gene_type:complete